MADRTMSGIIHVCGEHDVGKTTFALQCGADLNRILFVDDDVKGRSTYLDLKEAGVEMDYWDLNEWSRGKTELAFHEKVMGELAKIKKGQYDAIIWDTWTNFAASFHAYVVRNEREFRTQWSAMGKFKGPQQWKEARKYEGEVIDRLGQLVDTVILISHLKPVYKNGVQIVGKYEPDVSPTMEKICRMRLWLRQNESGRPVPTGLVLKRVSKVQIENRQFHGVVNVLPRKLTPREDEHSLWDTIWRYWDDPVGDRAPLPEETPNAYELSIIENTLTDDQMVIYNKVLDQHAIIQDEESAMAGDEFDGAVVEKVKEMVRDRKPLPVIAKELDLTVQDVTIIKATMGDETAFG